MTLEQQVNLLWIIQSDIKITVVRIESYNCFFIPYFYFSNPKLSIIFVISCSATSKRRWPKLV